MDKQQPSENPRSGFGTCLTALLLILLVLLALLLHGCGGGTGTDAAVVPTTPGTMAQLQGVVADGYLAGAQVFLDINGNKLADPDEPQTVTGSGGRYSLEVPAGQEALYPVVARAEQGRTVDEEDNATLADDYILETPIGRHGFISPLTTLVKQELDKNAVFSETDAVNKIRTQFGLGDSVSFWQNYLADTSATSQQAHATARLLAGLQGRMLEQLRQNLGGELQEADYLPATRMVSDLQLQYAADITGTLTGIHTAAAHSRDQLVDQLLTTIDLSGLNRQCLNRYRQLVDKKQATWDATPPTILAQDPQPGAEVPVTTQIQIAFSEALDPATIASDAVVVSGDGRSHTGTVSYDKNRLLLTLTLDQPLNAYTDYNLAVSAKLADPAGNPLGTVPSWTFRTLFEQSPPALPSF